MDINPLRNINIKQEALKTEEGSLKKLPEQVKGNSAPKISDASLAEENLKASLTELLSSLHISGTEENMELILSLVKNKLPVSKENMQKLNQLVKLFKGDRENAGAMEPTGTSLDKALFMIKNHMPLSSYGKLERLLKGDSGLIKSFESILNTIESMPESPLKNALKAVFLEAGSEDTSPKPLMQEETGAIPDKALPQNDGSMPKESNKTQQFTSPSFNQEETPLAGKENLSVSLTANEDIALESEKDGEDKSLLKESIKHDKAISSEGKDNTGKMIIDEKEEILFSLKKGGEQEKKLPEKMLSKEEALQKVFLKFESPEEINDLLNDLRIKALKAEEIMEKSGGQKDETGRIINNFKENIEFLNEIKTCVYIPIPIHTSKGPMEGELYVFGEKAKKKKGKAISALIALNTLNIGRVEAYIQKSGKNINIQFRMNHRNGMELLKKNTGLLGNLLKESGYTITALDVIEMEKAFNITDREPDGKPSIEPKEFKDIKFDVKA